MNSYNCPWGAYSLAAKVNQVYINTHTRFKYEKCAKWHAKAVLRCTQGRKHFQLKRSEKGNLLTLPQRIWAVKRWRERTIHCKTSKDSKVRKSGACLWKGEKDVNQFY